MESAQKTNKLIFDTTKGTDETVNWTGSGRSKSFRKKHHDMKLRREPNTCHWCGDMRGPHKWADCPANGHTCLKCGGYDHFARVCLEQSPLNKKFNQPRNNTIHRNGQNQTISQYIQFKWVTNQKLTQDTCPLDQSMINQTSIMMSNYYITVQHTQWNKAKGIIDQVINIMLIYHARQIYLLILILNSKLTLPQHVIQFHMTLSKNISQTPNFRNHVICYTLVRVGRPIHTTIKKCKKYHTLVFEVLTSNIMTGKPALLSGKDCVNMGIIKISADNVYCV